MVQAPSLISQICFGVCEHQQDSDASSIYQLIIVFDSLNNCFVYEISKRPKLHLQIVFSTVQIYNNL